VPLAESRRRGQRPRHEVEPIATACSAAGRARAPPRSRARACIRCRGWRSCRAWGAAKRRTARPAPDVDDFVAPQVAAFHERRLRPEREQRAAGALHRRGARTGSPHEDAGFVEFGVTSVASGTRRRTMSCSASRCSSRSPERRHHHGIEDVVGEPPPGDALATASTSSAEPSIPDFTACGGRSSAEGVELRVTSVAGAAPTRARDGVFARHRP